MAVVSVCVVPLFPPPPLLHRLSLDHWATASHGRNADEEVQEAPQRRVLIGVSSMPSGLALATRDNGVGARVAFCREHSSLAELLTPNDELRCVSGANVRNSTTVDIKHRLLARTARPTAGPRPLTVLDFTPGPGGMYRARRRSSVCV